MAITDNIIYRLKPEAGDTEPHSEIGGAAALTGGTITLVNDGAEDAWRFEGGQATAGVPLHTIQGSADATGLTAVHVNRILQTLQREGLIERDRRMVRFPSWQRMQDVADFNARYLHMRDLAA